MESLCKSCVHVRQVTSGAGSKFLLCRLSQSDKRMPKYPRQPVVRCGGHEEGPGGRRAFSLEVVPSKLAICRLQPDADMPEWATGAVASITRTAAELSVVCAEENVPSDVPVDSGWRCLRVAEKLDFSIVGVIAAISSTLADANISVFVISTFNTDYVLIKECELKDAIQVLRAAGHAIQLPA